MGTHTNIFAQLRVDHFPCPKENICSIMSCGFVFWRLTGFIPLGYWFPIKVLEGLYGSILGLMGGLVESSGALNGSCGSGRI